MPLTTDAKRTACLVAPLNHRACLRIGGAAGTALPGEAKGSCPPASPLAARRAWR